MVSQFDSTDRALAIRKAPSISSRASTTRRHRQNRSHHGGSSYLPQNEFPVFSNTGDVEIVIGNAQREQRYLLHRLILSQCSGFFEAGTSELWSRGQGQPQETARADESDSDRHPAERALSAVRPVPGKQRWRYELDTASAGDDIPILVQKTPSSSLFGGDPPPRPPPIRNKPVTPQSGFFRSMANFSAMHIPQSQAQAAGDPFNEVMRDYDNLFRIFYNYAPTLDAVNIANAYIECKSLLNLADMYDALEVVGPRIDHHLLQFQGRLWKQIAKYPPSYLKLGYLARSKVIFAESLVHVVGQWPVGAAQLRSQLPEHVMDVVEDKVDELEELKGKIEGKLFRLTLTNNRGERVTPFNSYFEWTAVSLFRQWLAENTSPQPPQPPVPASDPRAQQPPPQLLPSPSAGKVYRLIGTGGAAYLSHDELKRFLRVRPETYSRESLKKFERKMDELKALAKEIVRPLMRNFLELDLGRDGGGLGYVTCTRVEERDFPWES